MGQKMTSILSWQLRIFSDIKITSGSLVNVERHISYTFSNPFLSFFLPPAQSLMSRSFTPPRTRSTRATQNSVPNSHPSPSPQPPHSNYPRWREKNVPLLTSPKGQRKMRRKILVTAWIVLVAVVVGGGEWRKGGILGGP